MDYVEQRMQAVELSEKYQRAVIAALDLTDKPPMEIRQAITVWEVGHE